MAERNQQRNPKSGSGASRGSQGSRGPNKGAGGSKGGSGGPKRGGGGPGAKRSSGPSRGRNDDRPKGRSGDQRRSGGKSSRDDDSRGPKRGNGGPPRGGRRGDDERRGDYMAGPKNWGGLARKGAAKVRDFQDEGLEDSPSAEERSKFKERQAKRQLEEDRREGLRAEARAAVERVSKGKSGPPRPKRTPKAKDRMMLPGRPKFQEDPHTAIPRLLGEKQAKKELRSLDQAMKAFGAERFGEAKKHLSHLVEVVPEVAPLRELLGLTLYRQGRWKEAAAELEIFREQAGTTEQNPVLADCYRGMGRWADVEVLWLELADASPNAGLVVEGRIVAAGALADQGKLNEAVALLAKGWRQPKRPHDHHLRRGYALADLYERSGDMPRARALFAWLAKNEPDFVDVKARLRNLG